MNPLDYPSLELCKELTEAGFPDTEKVMYKYPDRITIGSPNFCWLPENPFVEYKCPSVVELLNKFHCFRIEKDGGFQVSDVYDEDYNEGVFTENRLPDALAKRWLYLKENDLLTK